MPSQRTVWIPESPSFRGLFAGATTFATNIVEQALQFDSYQKCEVWCNQNKGRGAGPMFEPVVHRFGASHIAAQGGRHITRNIE